MSSSAQAALAACRKMNSLVQVIVIHRRNSARDRNEIISMIRVTGHWSNFLLQYSNVLLNLHHSQLLWSGTPVPDIFRRPLVDGFGTKSRFSNPTGSHPSLRVSLLNMCCFLRIGLRSRFWIFQKLYIYIYTGKHRKRWRASEQGERTSERARWERKERNCSCGYYASLQVSIWLKTKPLVPPPPYYYHKTAIIMIRRGIRSSTRSSYTRIGGEWGRRKS